MDCEALIAAISRHLRLSLSCSVFYITKLNIDEPHNFTASTLAEFDANVQANILAFACSCGNLLASGMYLHSVKSID